MSTEITPGCFRCHDGKHKSEDDRTVKANDCNACHTSWRRAAVTSCCNSRPPARNSSIRGDYDLTCYDCHNGGL